MNMSYKTILENSFSKYTKKHFYAKFYSIISLPFTILFLKLRFNPNLVTSISWILGILSSIAYLRYNILFAIILFELSEILDYSDGSVAVFTNKTSKFGAWFDLIGDRITFRLLVIGISIGVFLKYNEPIILILGFIMLSIKTMRDYNELYVNSVSNYWKTTQSAKSMLKDKLGYLSVIVEFGLDLMTFALPFIALFNFNIILYFFSVYLFTEVVRITADLLSTGRSFLLLKNEPPRTKVRGII